MAAKQTTTGEPILEGLPICVPRILLPRKDIDLSTWSVVACDQFESEPAYWKELDELVGESPSTLRLVFPEVYLSSVTGCPPEEDTKRIKAICQTMKDYIANDTFVEREPAFLALDRVTEHVPARKGLMIAVDLEEYNYNCPEPTLIRPTEKTIVARLPPRIAIREDAPLELPHILMIIDDPEKTVIEPLFADESLAESEYEVTLLKGAGSIRGLRVTEAGTAHFEKSMKALSGKEIEAAEAAGRKPATILIGDGNHSLATAKSCWEALKAQEGTPMNHPQRYALVELQNLHDDGVVFEPIHRIVSGANVDSLQEFLETAWDCKAKEISSPVPKNAVVLVRGPEDKVILTPPEDKLAIVSMSTQVDAFVAANPESSISYVHGEAPVLSAAAPGKSVGLLLPALDKSRFLATVHEIGTLPRKAFSMGEANEKRFYLEARNILPSS